MNKQPEHFEMMADLMEVWASQGFHILTADEKDPLIAHYVLTGVMLTMEGWMEIEQEWEDEEEKKGPNTDVFQKGTMEGKLYDMLREREAQPQHSGSLFSPESRHSRKHMRGRL